MPTLSPAHADLLARVLQQAVSQRQARLALVAPAFEAERIRQEIRDLESILRRLDSSILADLRPRLPA